MLNNNALLKRAGALLLLYLVFAILFQATPLKSVVTNYVCGVGNIFNSTFYGGGEINFRPIADNERKGERIKEYEGYDMLVILKSKKQIEKAKKDAKAKGQKQVRIKPIQYAESSWNQFGIIFTFFLSLVIVTPFSRTRKIIVVVVGFIVLSLFLASKFWFSLGVKYFNFYERFQAGFQNEIVVSIINRIHLLIDFAGFGLLFATVLWLLFGAKKFIKIS